MANNEDRTEVSDYWGADNGDVVFLRASLEYMEDEANFEEWGTLYSIDDKREQKPLTCREEEECDSCEGKCRANETEECEECKINLRIGCANNPSDHSIFDGCCDDCREEEEELCCSECRKGISYDMCIHYEEDTYLCPKCGEGKDDICIECYKRPCECEEEVEECDTCKEPLKCNSCYHSVWGFNNECEKCKNTIVCGECDEEVELKEYNGKMLPKYINGREVLDYPNAGRFP